MNFLSNQSTLIVNLHPRGKAKYAGAPKKELELVEMKVCKNCLTTTRYKGYPENKNHIYESFGFSEYLLAHDSGVNDIDIHSPETMPLNEYSENQKLLSRLIRSNQNFRCEDCGRDFSKAKDLLEMHHVDGAKYNNARDNLRVLCVCCHSRQPSHQHIVFSPKYKRCLELVSDNPA